MSYILDALRKADAQRERSRAPGLHDQPAQRADAGVRSAWGRSPLLWGAIGIGVLLVAGGAWQMAQPVPTALQPPERAALASGPGEPAPAQPELRAATAVVPPPPEPRPVAPARPAQAAAAPVPAASRASAAAPGGAASAEAPAIAAGAADPGPVPAGAPRLAISGGVYSQNPAQRMLIVGGQVFNEGSEVAPGVRLEQVRPHQAVLSWRGQRYAVAF